MGRTITGYKKDKANEFIGLKKSKKKMTKKKNISKWGKSHLGKEDAHVDTFELQSPRDLKHPLEVQWE